jgi:trehalose 6-phosphate synthase
MRAIETPEKDKRRLMRAMRRRVADHDVQRWASRFLEALAVAPERPQRTTKEQKADDDHATADRHARDLHQAALDGPSS